MATPKEVTQNYLNKYNLQQILQDSINKMLTVLPADPLLFLSDELKEIAPKPKPQVVFVLGGPGAGKGTQCANIVREFGFCHLSAGDLLRAERQAGGPQAEMIESYIKSGKIVPVEVTVGLLKKAMEQNIAIGNKNFLIDGFPRNQDNLDGWNNLMGDFADVRFVLFFDCPEATMEARLLNRGLTSGRDDDNAETIRKRFATYVNETMPVIQAFEKKGGVRQISAVPPPEEVFLEVQNVFAEFAVQTTYGMIKPDAVGAGNENRIIARLREDGFKVLAKKRFQFTADTATKFYAEHVGRDFFPGLLAFMTSGPVIGLALQRPNAIKGWRSLIGPTNSNTARDQAPNSIRALYGTDGQRNACHGSDSVYSANRELGLIFPGNQFSNKAGKRIIIAGAPAAGKGTQCELIKAKYGVQHLSTGDLLRAEVKAGTALGKEAQQFMDAGKLVPDELIISMVKQRLQGFAAIKNGWLLDGFPRTQVQAKALADAGIVADVFLLVDVPDDILTERVVGRRLDPVTGKIYHMKYSPPESKEVEERLTQRADDTAEKIQVRIEQFRGNVNAVQDSYRNVFVQVNGNQDPQVVFKEVQKVLDKN